MIIIKFIFPQNYHFRNKFFGIFDYSTIIFNLIWDILIFLILNLFIHNLNIKISIFIILCFPLFLLSISGLNGENILIVLYYFIKFLLKKKLLFFNK